MFVPVIVTSDFENFALFRRKYSLFHPVTLFFFNFFLMHIGIFELHYHLLRRHYRNYILYFIQILSYCVPNVGVSVEMS
jgi:hypothetical protein